MATYFVQECPTCGRNLQVRVEYLGKRVVCQHCKAKFEACDPSSAAYPPMESSLSLLARADQLLIESGARAGMNTSARTAG
jgi:transposase-like protein